MAAKNALSVIESAVYAHDAEKKWVQSHPAILYEMETLKSAMYDDIISGDKTKRHWAKILINLAEKLNLEHDFMIIFQKKFSSSFKATVGDILIWFPNVEDGVVPLGNVVTTLGPTGERKSNFFHIFSSLSAKLTAHERRGLSTQLPKN